MDNIYVRELRPDEMTSIMPLVEEWNQHIAPETLRARLDRMVEIGYRCIAAFDGPKLVGIAGIWSGCRFWCGRYLDVDNVIVSEQYRNRGVGSLMMQWLHDEARRLKCDVVALDSYLRLTDAHRFYEKLGYEKLGYHIVKQLASEADEPGKPSH